MALVLNVCIRADTRHSAEAAPGLGAGRMRAGLGSDEETLLLLAGPVLLPPIYCRILKGKEGLISASFRQTYISNNKHPLFPKLAPSRARLSSQTQRPAEVWPSDETSL